MVAYFRMENKQNSSMPGTDYARNSAEKLIKQFDKETDPAAAILAGAMIENALERLLRKFLVPSASNEDDLFDGSYKPLSTFAAKITAAHRCGLISSKFCRDLHIIRRIRNYFAHNTEGSDFSEGSIKQRVKELVDSFTDLVEDARKGDRFKEGPNIRDDFLISATWMLMCLEMAMDDVKTLPQKKLEFGYSWKELQNAIEADAANKNDA